MTTIAPLSRSRSLTFSARRIASQALEPFFATAAALLSRKAGSALTLAYVRRNVDWDVAITAAAAAGLTRCVEIEPRAARASAAHAGVSMRAATGGGAGAGAALERGGDEGDGLPRSSLEKIFVFRCSTERNEIEDLDHVPIFDVSENRRSLK